FLNLVGFALCLGGLLNLIAAALPRKASRWFVGIAIFLCTTVMMVELLIGDAYFNFMRPALVFVSAGGVLTDFSDIMIDMILNNLDRIAIALIPLWLLLLSGKNEGFRKKRCVAASLAISLAGAGVGLAALNVSAGGLNTVIPQYDFNNSMKRNGITVSMFMELTGLSNRANGLIVDEFDFEPVYLETVTVPTTAPEEETANPTVQTAPAMEETTAPAAEEPTTPATEATSAVVLESPIKPTSKLAAKSSTKPAADPESFTEPATSAVTEAATEAVTEPIPEETEPKVYNPHVISGLDFGELAETENDPTRKKLFTYLDSLTPALENEYTGMFEGKNLILITAESFNYALIDPELTPTLYRLCTQGIHFTNAYVPLWTGNTSGGEMAIFSGLAMNCDMYTYSKQQPFNTIGRQLMNLGYFSRAYHNNGYYFYDRDKTHEDLGYEKYIGIGNGLEEGVEEVWPASDQEMLDFTLPQYIDQQPFSIYYMTVSAHCRYNFLGNAQSKKNQDLVQDLPYSTPLKAYIAANLELEKGLTSLVAQLEEAGIADDTVIVMTADHFPYGLGTAWGNDHNCLAELYGVNSYDEIERDRNTLIIWSGCLEGKGLQIDAPVCSLDILPTLSNLFGLEYDSRLSIGRDVFGTEEAIVPWPDYSWVTELGKYDSSTQKFTPFVDQSLIPEDYVDRISSIVRTRVSFSRSVQGCQFFTTIQNAMEK
ncbi:MAG: sulfatase-like hydrolase/transferase, partial [Faecousia sp.]